MYSAMPRSLLPSSVYLWNAGPTGFVSAVTRGAVGLGGCWF